ncbi:hypothetical protein JCM11491_000471 [Sporobolomyces phaffii]
MPLSYAPLRPRVLVQLGVIATICVTLYLTFDSASGPPSTRIAPSFPSSPPAPAPSAPGSLKVNPQKSVPSKSDASHPSWKFTKPKEQLGPCDKIFLFTFLPWWGFASEFILYIRAKSMAHKLGYTFLPDDSAWNYGRLSSYFAPLPLSCIPPADWNDYRKAYPIHQGQSWRFDKKGRPRRRLRYSRAFLSNLDDWTREAYFVGNETRDLELYQLRRKDERHRVANDRWILEEGGTLPSVFEEVFGDQARAVSDTWKLNEGLRQEVNALKAKIGLDESRRYEGSDSGRGPVIGLHVRLGDKATEYVHDSQEMGIANEFGNLTVYLEAAHDAHRRLVSKEAPPLSANSAAVSRFSTHARPTLLLMTAEPGIAEQLASLPLAKPFDIVETPAALGPALNGDTGGSERLKAVDSERGKTGGSGGGPKAYAGGAVPIQAQNSTDLRDGYSQSTFNSRPLEERVEHTQAFVRDLALLTSIEVDALVVSGASNIGRLAMLIGGPQAVIGPRDDNGQSLGGRIRSIDAHYYPTSYPASVYSRYTDVEDLENAAFVPDEQLHRAGRKGGAKAQ